MIELITIVTSVAGPAEIFHHLPSLALQDYGAFQPLISNFKNILRSLALLGILVGTAVKATAGNDTDKHERSHKMIGTCLFAFVFVTIAPGLYDLMFGWAGK